MIVVLLTLILLALLLIARVLYVIAGNQVATAQLIARKRP